MSSQQVLNHGDNVYLAVTVAPTSHFYDQPEALAVHPSITPLGMVGQLRDVQLLSTPRETWPRTQGEILAALNSLDGVRRVDVQDPPWTRVKRGDDL